VILDISIFPSSTAPTHQSAKVASLVVLQTVKPGCIEKTVDPTGSSMSVWIKEEPAHNNVRKHLMHRKRYEVLNHGSLGHSFGAGGKRLMFKQYVRSLMMTSLSMYELENALDDDVAFIRQQMK
jgi:hypothetical protein